MSEKGLDPIVTEIQPITQQIGEHILSALQRDDDSIAVLTSIVPGLGVERVVSIPISKHQFQKIQLFLQQSKIEQMELEKNNTPEEERPIGFELPIVNKDDK
jgi:hypothetical protein